MPEVPQTTRQAGLGPVAKRRRAARACLSCRSRKVRCDVARSGPPCMNCSLDGIACVVKARKPKTSSRHGTQSSPREDHHSVASPEDNDEHAHETPPHTVDPGVNASMGNSDLDQLTAYNEETSAIDDPIMDLSYAQDIELALEESNGFAYGSTNSCESENAILTDNWLADCIQEHDKEYDTGCIEGHVFHQRRATQKNSVLYTYYPFLTLDNLFNCRPHDVDFLEAEGCFHLPTRRIMDQIVRQYFLHVHPLLPILNEGDFWEMYYNKRSGESMSMSLLVFQAMMFVSCNFVNWSPESTKSIGYKNTRGLRATFYRRAKLLFDFGAESSAVAISQAALLLSYWTPPIKTELRTNTVWLSIAVENAKNAEAPYYATLPTCPRPSTAEERAVAKNNNLLKRLWWCCVIRDRILPLGLRRGIQITRAHFDFERHRPLSLMDLDDEIHRSIVYNPDAKRELIRLLSHVLDLCVILTDVLLLVFPLDGALDLMHGRSAIPPLEDENIRNSKKALVHWYTAAVATSAMAADDRPNINWNKHESVMLYTHLMFTYYHSARMALYNHELQHYLALVNENCPIDNHKLMETRDAIQNACSNITENIRGLNQRHLTRWLPISAVACVAFPLALHVLNTHLSASAARHTPTSGTLIEVMMTMHSQYDGVQWVAKLVRHLVEIVQSDSTLSAGRNAASWAELLTFKPRTYLRLALAMDLSMSSGRIPDHKDFPAHLEAKVLRSLAGPERVIYTQQGRSASRLDTVVADDAVLDVGFFDKKIDVLDREGSNSRQEGAEMAVADIIVDSEPSQSQGFEMDISLDGLEPLGSLSTEMDSFFDPVLADLAATDEATVEDLPGGFPADTDTEILTS